MFKKIQSPAKISLAAKNRRLLRSPGNAIIFFLYKQVAPPEPENAIIYFFKQVAPPEPMRNFRPVEPLNV